MNEQLAYASADPTQGELAQGQLTQVEQLGQLMGSPEAAEDFVAKAREHNAYIKDSQFYSSNPEASYERAVEDEISREMGFIGGTDLVTKLSSGEVSPDDLYDATGALTMSGRIAAGYVKHHIQDRYDDYRPGQDEGLDIVVNALNANRVVDEDITRAAAAAEDWHRRRQSAANFVARTTEGLPAFTHDYNEESRKYVEKHAWPDLQVVPQYEKEHPDDKSGADIVQDVNVDAYQAASENVRQETSGIRGVMNKLTRRELPTRRGVSGDDIAAEANKIAYEAGSRAQVEGEAAADQEVRKKTALEEQKLAEALKDVETI